MHGQPLIPLEAARYASRGITRAVTGLLPSNLPAAAFTSSGVIALKIPASAR